MKEIKYGDEKIFLSEKHYRKLTFVLPYWGMRLDDHARLAGALHGSVRTLIADDPALIRDIERLLAHTGLQLEAAGTPNVKVGAAPEEDGRKLAILAGHQTYYLKPGHYPSTQDLGRYIYKGLWLPPAQSYSIRLYHPYQSFAAEWIAYILLMDTMGKGHAFPQSASLSPADYQFLVKNVLTVINPAFSVLQKDQKARSKPDWPEWPIALEKAVDTGKEKGLNKSPLPPEKQQPKPADTSITDDIPEETSDQNVFYNTFHRRNSPEEARVVFNPFKNKTPAEPESFDPFKNEKSSFRTHDHKRDI